MKRLLLLMLVSTSVGGFGNESTQVQETKPVYEELKAPFNSMSLQEQRETGVAKLTGNEQSALIAWLEGDKTKQEEESNDGAQKVIITEILDGGKVIFFSDGTELSFDSSGRKKTKGWKVGDEIGIGGTGRRGGLNIYHLSSGVKVKGYRDQAPTGSKQKSGKK